MYRVRLGMMGAALGGLFLAACSPETPEARGPVPAGDPSIEMEPDGIRAHMAFLADDLLEGREAGTRGEALAALYIRTQFEQIGLKPAGESGGYLQTFPVRTTRLVRGSVDFTVIGPRGDGRRFENGGDIAVFGDPLEADQEISGEVIFAGYGIDAPELEINDYENLDVKGKVVAVLGGPPAFLPPAEAAHYGSTWQQRRTAEAHGAMGVIILWTPALEERWQFDRFRNILGRTDFDWIGKDGTPHVIAPGIRLRAFVRASAAQALLAGTPHTLAELIDAAKTRSPEGFPLETQVSLARKSVHDDSLTATNVAGLLPGSDPRFSNEVVVVSAHYDHIGIGEPVDGDAIYNGAGDNALGTAIVIELARKLAAMKTIPRRSVLFLAVGAEEKGLIGSDYFAENPTVERGRLAANINIDGGLPFYDFRDVIGFGSEHSQVSGLLAEAAGELGISLAPDPFPGQGFFARSDQYSFIRRGIPGVFLFTGFTSMDGENVGREIWDRINIEHVHKPSDDLSLPFDYEVIAKFADVARRLVLRTAAASEAPKWYEDSAIGQIFAPDRPKARRPE
ncbi:MAG: M28 family peptidase [Alphaproteobacteria bacterium]